MNYGLSKFDISRTYAKIERQTNFLKGHYIEMQGQKIPIYSFFKNTFINQDRYIAELQHRVWSLVEYSQNRQLENVFLTLTLPSEYHEKKKQGNKIISNPKFANQHIELYDIDTHDRSRYYYQPIFKKYKSGQVVYTGKYKRISLNSDDYTPSKGSQYLTHMFSTIRKDRAFQDIEKDNRVYFRITEPHHDGTPHLHVSLFLPKDSIARFVQMVHRLFPAPQSDISTTYIPPNYQIFKKVWFDSSKKLWHDGYKVNQADNHYLKFQLNNSVGYLMKYIYKTLDDLRDGKNFGAITLWYIHHGICRFYTSRTLISLDIYRPLGGQFTLLELTSRYRNNELTVYLDSSTRVPQLIIANDMIIFKKQNYVVKQFSDEQKQEMGLYVEKSSDTIGYIQKIEIELDGVEYYIYKNEPSQTLYLKQQVKELIDYSLDFFAPVKEMYTANLWIYYHSLNPISQNAPIYQQVREELINRYVLDEDSMTRDQYYEAMEVFLNDTDEESRLFD